MIIWRVHRQLLVFLCVSSIVIIESCYRRPSEGNVIARVGNAVLTKDEALRMLDTTRADLDIQLKTYTLSWVNNELIYQEAKRHGIEGSLEFQQQLLALRRDMLIQEFLKRLLYSDTTKITDEQLQRYYHEHEKEFFVREQVLKLNAIGFRTREQASSFAASIVRGLSWDSTTALLRKRSLFDNDIVVEISQQYVSQQTLFPEELWKVALTLTLNELSYPIRTAQGFFIIQVLARYQPGTIAEYDLVKDEIRERFIVEQTRKRYNEILETLRKRTSVEIMLPIPQSPDTAHTISE